MTIAKRLYILIIFVGIAMLLAAGLNLYQIQRVFDAADYANANTVPSLIEIDGVSDNVDNMRVKIWQSLAAMDTEKKKKYYTGIESDKAKVEKALAKYEKDDISDNKDKALLTDVRTKIAAYYALLNRVITKEIDGKHEEALQEMFSSHDIIEQMTTAIQAHRQYNIQLGDTGSNDAKQTLNYANWLSAGISLMSILVITIMGLTLIKKIVGSLEEAMRVTTAVAAGDLTRPIDGFNQRNGEQPRSDLYRNSSGNGCDRNSVCRNCHWQHGFIIPHRATSGCIGRNRLVDGRTHQHS